MNLFTEPIYDIHCHIVPGVDDGADSMEEALLMLEEEIRQGVGHIVLTPHYRVRMFENAPDKVKRHFDALKEEAEKRFPELKIHLGCEFHAHMDMEEDFRSREHITMAGSDFLLLEFSGRHMKSFIKERTMAALDYGFTPIIAHVERYPAVTESPDLLYDLKKTEP